jgi:hypothetical protein
MSEMPTQLDLLMNKAENTARILDNHSDVIIGEIAKVNRLEKIILDLQAQVSDLQARVKPTLKRKSEPDQDPEPKPKKTKITQNTNLRDEYIERLKNGRCKSRAWAPGMSKYTSVSYNTQINKWFWVSQIFDENLTYFKTRNEAEKHYEKILAKYNIPVEYIIRKGYDESQDDEEVD